MDKPVHFLLFFLLIKHFILGVQWILSRNEELLVQGLKLTF